ncbi:TPA: hypothetical protein ACH3X1_003596 [Trebouxia sp. C0004]
MNGILIISTRTGACLYSKAHCAGFGIATKSEGLAAHFCSSASDSSLGHLESMRVASMLYALNLQACAASSNVRTSQDLHSQTVLRSLLTDTSLLQFAAADNHGVMVCVSTSKCLKGAIAEFVCKEALQLFVTRFDSLLSARNPVSRAKGFTASLHSLYQQVPQQIAQAIASKLAPMQLLWIMVAQADALLRAEAAPPRRRWWHQLKRSTAISPSPDTSSYQFLWTNRKHCSERLLAHDLCKTLPGTRSTANEIIQVVTQAARRLTTTSQAINKTVHHVQPSLRSTNVPLHLHKEDAYRPVQQPTAIPPFTEYTPRMVQLDIGVGRDGRPPNASIADPKHRLLVMQQDGIIVAVPLMLDSQLATVQAAKSAIMHEVQQLAEVIHSIANIVPLEKRRQPAGNVA